jgi:hypothetical protein
MQNQINTNPLIQFTQVLKAAELSQAKEVKLSIQQARLLNIALTEVLNKITQDYEALFNELKQSTNTEVVTVSMDGGGFSDKK